MTPRTSPYTRFPRFRRVVLETSLKPYQTDDPAAMLAVSRQMLDAWRRLAEPAEALGILLWVGDGSELLEFTGELDQRLEWGRYLGFCNLDAREGLYFPGWYQDRPGVPVRDDMPEFSYGSLAAIIASLRTAAEELWGRAITVGATFDPGPEFAYSRFKYHDHPEILFDQPPGEHLAPMHFVTAQAVLQGDAARYAAFPDGIPDGTSLGAFLAGQMLAAQRLLGYDYLWLSNGFGYSHFAWIPGGELLARGQWRTDLAERERQRTLRFWHDFRAVAPDLPVEVRGTNFTLGMDLATDAASHLDIVAAGRLDMMPPNLPVLQADLLAIDVVTYLTRMAWTPGERIVYRTYVNDPWFEQNPWYDIYNREPLEVVTAMSVGRVNEAGSVDGPTDLHVLTIDTERGEVLAQQANETVAHYLRALEERADAPGPVVWVYPVKEYHDLLAAHPERLPQVYCHDHLVTTSVDGGLPLLTVCAADRFTRLQAAGKLADAVYLAPVPLADWDYAEALCQHVTKGGRVMLYGSLEQAPDAIRSLLGLGLAEPVGGDLAVDCRLPDDDFETAPGDRPLRHFPDSSGGGIREVAAGIAPGEVLMTVASGDAERVYAVARRRSEWSGGEVAWWRGSVPYNVARSEPYMRQRPLDPKQFFRPQDVARRLLGELGLRLRCRRPTIASEPPRVFIKRHRGAWQFVGSKPDTTVRFLVQTRDGAPVFTECNTRLIDGFAEDCFQKTLNVEARFFIAGQTSGVLKAKAQPFGAASQRCLELSGCERARVTIYPDPEALAAGRVMVAEHPRADYQTKLQDHQHIPFTVDRRRGCLVVAEWTGTLYVKW